MRQIKGNKFLCDSHGLLNEYSIGWSKIPFKNCTINQYFFMKKSWNKYMWISENFVFRFEVIDIGYASIVHADFYEIKNNKSVNKSCSYLLNKHIILDDKINSYAHYKSKNKFINILRSSNHLNLDFKWDELDITSIVYLDLESLNLTIPWDYNHFHYTSKHMNLKTEGILRVGSIKYELSSASCFIDYGRGVWNRKREWDWLTSGFIDKDNRYISINLGAKYTDNTGVNENFMKINDKVYKIDKDVVFNYNKENETINIKSLKNDEVNLEFKLIKYHIKVNNAIIFKLKCKQMIGNINGYIQYKDKKFEFENVIGWCENYFAKW
ncbi:MAG: DUF2804 domain-containing protein [Paraclostridium sp.]|uniref:DUF2804 domain-containing protein n=1 Tax=Paraclostridium sp. TaxID=2023273 RepID=UPI003F3C136C